MKSDQHNDPTAVGDFIGRNHFFKSVATQTSYDAGGTDPIYCSRIPPSPKNYELDTGIGLSSLLLPINSLAPSIG